MAHPKGFRNRSDERSTEPVPVGEVIDGLLAEAPFARGMPIATLASRWSEVTGQRLASETEPAALEAGVLLVRATNGPWGAQARFLAEQIRANANHVLGPGTVLTVRVTIDPSFRRDL